MSKLKWRLARLIVCIQAALLLCACGSSASTSRSIIMAAPPAEQSPVADTEASAPQPEILPEDVAVDLSVAQRSLSSGYAGDNAGCYNLIYYDDGSADVCYFDYGAVQMRLLDITAQQAGTYGRLAELGSSATPVLAGGQLFIFKQRASLSLVESSGAGAQAAIIRMDADGGALQSLTFGPGITLQMAGAALWDGESLYFLMQDTDGEVTETALARLNVATMDYEELHRFEPGFDYTLDGFWEKGPVLCAAATMPSTGDADFNEAWDSRTYSLYTLGLRSGTQQALTHWTQGTATTMEDDTFYHWNADEGALHALNADTGADSVVAEGFAPTNYVVAQMQTGLLDGLLRLQFSGNMGYSIHNFTINPADGQVNEPPTGNLGENVAVLAEGDDAFLVRNGDKFVRKELISPGYNPESGATLEDNYVSVAEYALIDKASYWAGQRNFTPIVDLVYGD